MARVAVPTLATDDSTFIPQTQAVKSLLWSEFAGKLSKASRVLVVVHQFNNTFDQALAMAALLKRNLRTEATILMISWPSMGSKFGYFYDEEEAQLSSGMMASVLIEIAQTIGALKLQIVAHSLGTRLTVMALRRF